MTLTLHLSAEIAKSLDAAAQSQGLAPADYALQVLARDLADQRKRREAVDLLQSWIDKGDAEEQRKAYDHLTQALDEDRPSERKLFPPELKGVTW